MAWLVALDGDFGGRRVPLESPCLVGHHHLCPLASAVPRRGGRGVIGVGRLRQPLHRRPVRCAQDEAQVRTELCHVRLTSEPHRLTGEIEVVGQQVLQLFGQQTSP